MELLEPPRRAELQAWVAKVIKRPMRRLLGLRRERECVVCGAPNEAKVCGGCTMVEVCSAECMAAHWPEHHEQCREVCEPLYEPLMKTVGQLAGALAEAQDQAEGPGGGAEWLEGVRGKHTATRKWVERVNE